MFMMGEEGAGLAATRMSGSSFMQSSGPLPSPCNHLGRSLSYNSVKLCDCLDLCVRERVGARVWKKATELSVCIFCTSVYVHTSEKERERER